MKLILVHWHDAGSGADVTEAKSHHRKSVGYEVENVIGVGVVISMEPDQLSGVHFIPWAMIGKIEKVEHEEG